MTTYDKALLDRAGKIARTLQRLRFRDGMMTYDAATVQSTGAFLIGELERLDQTLHEPLVSVTWGRDIQLRSDVTAADDVSSFTNSTFAALGGATPGGKAWIGKDATAIPGVSLDIGKTAYPLSLWGMELSYTLPELMSAQALGRPVDAQKYEAIKLKHNMDIDEQVYIGDSAMGFQGLVNSALVTNVSNVKANADSKVKWADKGPDDILADVNELLSATWAESGWAVMPEKLLLPPSQFGLITTAKVSEAGNISVLEYLRQNSLCNAANNKPLDIQPVKWLVGRGTSNTDRMVAYTNDENRVRFPMVPLQRTPIEYRSLFQITTYWGRLGVVEFVYPETVGYRDGI